MEAGIASCGICLTEMVLVAFKKPCSNTVVGKSEEGNKQSFSMMASVWGSMTCSR